MHPQRIILVILAGLGGLFVFLPWAKVPMLGTVNGINNGAGMFSLFCIGAVLVIPLVSGSRPDVIPSGAKIATGLLGAGIVISAISYYSTVTNAAKQMAAVNSMSMFGMSAGGIFKDSDFSLDTGVYLTGAVGLIITLVAIAFSPPNEASVPSEGTGEEGVIK